MRKSVMNDCNKKPIIFTTLLPDFETDIYTPRNSDIYFTHMASRENDMYNSRLHYMVPVVSRNFLNLISINLFSDSQDVDLSRDQIGTLPHKYDNS